MTSWKGCRCCWGSRSCCLIRHGVFIITSCARVLLASSSSSFFLFFVCTGHQKVGSNTSEPSVCVYVKMDTKETKRKKKTCCCCCCCTISSKENQKRESDSREFTTPPPFCLHYLTSKKKKKRNRDFDLDFFDQLTSIEEFILLTGGFLSGIL